MGGSAATVREDLFGRSPGFAPIMGLGLEQCENSVPLPKTVNADVDKDGSIFQYDGMGLAGEKLPVIYLNIFNLSRKFHGAVWVEPVGFDAVNTGHDGILRAEGSSNP